MKVRMEGYKLEWKTNIWWRDLKISNGLKENILKWLEYKKLFNKQYMLESYYERKTKQFDELRLSQMTTEDLINKF